MKHRRLAIFVAAVLLSFATQRQSALFASNQHTYFVRGLAKAGVGFLSQDWLIGTKDPFPVFTAVVQLSSGALPHAAHALQAMLQALYIVCLLLVAESVLVRTSVRRLMLLATAVIVVHSDAFGDATARVYGDARVLIVEGLAGQYLLGSYLQPSSFGVLLVAAVFAVERDRPIVGVAATALACSLHPTYLLSGVSIFASWAVGELGRRRHLGRVAVTAIVGMALVMPIVLYTWLVFRPTSPEIDRAAKELFVHFRIPHHADIATWWGRAAIVQIAWMVAGVFATRNRQLRIVLVGCVIGSGVLTLAQLVSGNLSLALLFPWRISTVLVPISTAVIIARAVDFAAIRLSRIRPLAYPVACAGLAFALFAPKRAPEPNLDEGRENVIVFARTHAARGQQYLVPPEFHEFRLRTGIPIFVDWKSPPVRDAEVLEWKRRLQMANAVKFGDSVAVCAQLSTIAPRFAITHVVLAADKEMSRCSILSPRQRDNYYAVYEIRAEVPLH